MRVLVQRIFGPLSSLASHEMVKRNFYINFTETQLTGSLTLCSLEMNAGVHHELHQSSNALRSKICIPARSEKFKFSPRLSWLKKERGTRTENPFPIL